MAEYVKSGWWLAHTRLKVGETFSYKFMLCDSQRTKEYRWELRGNRDGFGSSRPVAYNCRWDDGCDEKDIGEWLNISVEEVKLPVADEPSVKGMHHQSSSSSLSSSYCEDESITTNTFEDAADGDNIEAIVIDNLLQTDHQNKTAKTEIDSPSAVEQSNTAADSLTEDIDIDELVVTNTSSSDAAAATAAKNINSISTEMCYSEDTSHHTELMPSSATNIQSDPFDKETLNTDDIPTDINEETELLAKPEATVAVRFDKEKYDEEIMRHVPIALKDRDINEEAELTAQTSSIVAVRFDKEKYDEEIMRHVPIPLPPSPTKKKEYDFSDGAFESKGALPDPRPSLPQLGDIPKLFHETHADEPRPSLPQLGDLNTLYHDDDQLEGQIAGDDIIKVDSVSVAHSAPDSVDAIATVHAAPDSGAKELGALADPRPSLPQLGDIPKLFHETHADEPRPSLPQLGDLNTLYHDDDQLEGQIAGDDIIKVDSITVAHAAPDSVDAIATGDVIQVDSVTAVHAAPDSGAKELGALPDPRPSLPQLGDIPKLFHETHADEPRPSLPQLGDLNTLYHDDDQLEGQIAGDDIIKVDSVTVAHSAPDSVDAVATVHVAPDSGTQELGALPDPRPSLPQLGDIPKLFHETHADEPRPSLPQLGDLNTLYHDDDQLLEGQIAGDDIIKVDSITVAHSAPDSVDAIATGDVIQVDSVTAVHAAPDSGAKELGALPDPRPSLPQLGDIPKLFHETHADEPRPSLPQLGDLDSLYPDTSEDNTVITTTEEKESETDGIKDDEIAIAFKESGSDKSRLSIASTGDASVERQFQESEAALPRASLPTVDDIPTLFTGSEIDKTTAAAAHNTVKEEPELSNRISLSADNLSSHLQDTVTIPTPIATKEINSSSSSSSSDDEKDSNDLVAGPADADSDKDTGGTVLTETPVTPPQSPTPLPAITEEKDGIKLERKQSSSSASSGWSFSETDSAPPPVPHRTRVPNQTEADILDDEVDGEHVDIKTIEKIFNDEKNQTVQTTEPETGVNENNNLDVDNTEASAAAAAGAAAAVGGERELNGTNREEQPFAPPVTPATGTHETSPTTDNLNKVLDDLDKLLESPIKEKTDDESLTSVSSKESSSSSSSDEEQQQQENNEKTKVDPLIITIDGRDAKLDIEPTTTDNNTADENKNTEPDEPTTGEHEINNEPSSEPTSEKHEKRKHSTSSDSDEEEPKHKKLEPVDAIEPSSESSHHIPLYRISKPPTKADIIDQNKDSPTRPPIDLYPELATEDTTNPDEVLKENVAPVASAAEPLDEDKPIDLDTTGPDLSPDPTDKTPLAPVSKSNTLNSTGAQSSEPDAASDIETEPETAPLNPTPIKEKPKKKKKSGLSGLLSCCPCKSKKSNKAKNRSS
ncbi:uncharacterized protein LOC141915283 [Tubulanus polymorphus]|uniref:uncharacterized protein LOC141915283 n=1 Tax=Tubulanus polymorphus TaxID=672921 RepID=UPI003DA41C06